VDVRCRILSGGIPIEEQCREMFQTAVQVDVMADLYELPRETNHESSPRHPLAPTEPILPCPFRPFFPHEETSSISTRYSLFNLRIALATAASYTLE
jgi:hypothetical protein